MTSQSIEIEEALVYFKKPCFQRLFEQLYQRCFSLGRLGGTVKISHLRADEIDALEGFLQKNYHEKKNLSISVNKIRTALSNTKFRDFSLEEIVIAYFQGSIVSKKEQEQIKRDEFETWFDECIDQYSDTPAAEFLIKIRREHSKPYSMLATDFLRNKDWIDLFFPNVINAINDLPYMRHEYQRIPIFAARISGNPHFFDVGERALLYLMYGICVLTNTQIPKKMNAERRREYLYKAGLLSDDLSNTVLTYGLYGMDLHGIHHAGMEDYVGRKEALTLTISNLTLLQRVWAATGVIYIVENPMIFYWLMEQQKNREMQAGIICSAGQPNQAVWILLDLLRHSGTKMFYAGDFDPEGLLIAQRMKERNGDYLELWHYTLDDYEKSKSKITITDKSLKKLQHLSNYELQKIGKRLIECKIAGYQENLLSLMHI